MTKDRTLLAGLAALGMACAGAARAGTNDILIGLDSKYAYREQGQVTLQPGPDAVLVMDISNPAEPRIRASLPLANSLLGPPTNLQITPTARSALSRTRSCTCRRAAPGKPSRTTSCSSSTSTPTRRS